MKTGKINKILKTLTIILSVVLIVEIIYLGIKLYLNRVNTTYYSTIESIIKDNDNYITVGLNDFKHSKLNDYKEPGYNKPTIQIYNKEKELIKESYLDLGYNGTFHDVVKTEDGYIAVGEITMDENQHKDKLTEGVIVKYDTNLKLIWRKNLQILDSTKLLSVTLDNDNNIIATGQSIYGQNYIGNHKTGGAIILKYDQDGNEKKRANIGGPTSGQFNDVVVTKDGYVAVGVLNKTTGIILKYDKNFKEKWHNYYGPTDSKGLTSISTSKDDYIVTTSKLKDKNNTDNYQAALLRYDKNGKLKKEITWQKENISRFEKTLISDDEIIALALYGNKEDNSLKNNSCIVKLNKDFEVQKEQTLEGKNIVTLIDIIKDKEDYLIAGYTDSKIKNLNTNGYDFFPIIVTYNKNLEQK